MNGCGGSSPNLVSYNLRKVFAAALSVSALGAVPKAPSSRSPIASPTSFAFMPSVKTNLVNAPSSSDWRRMGMPSPG